MALPGVLLFLLLGRKDSFERVARLGDVRKINLGGYGLRSTRRTSTGMAGVPGAATEMRTDLFGLVLFQ